MDFLQQLMQSIGQQPKQQTRADGGIVSGSKITYPALPRDQRAAVGQRPQQQAQPQPFKMYEDMSFEGDPRQFIQQNPGFTFYEDGKFAPPQVRNQQQIQQAPFKMYEDGSFQGNPQAFRATNPGTKFYEDNTFSNPAPQVQKDPIAQLRQLLGF